MPVTMTFPREAERTFREAWGDGLDVKAFEALIIQGYREKMFGVGRVAELVGLSTSLQAEQWLADRRVERNCVSSDVSGGYSAFDALRTPPPR